MTAPPTPASVPSPDPSRSPGEGDRIQTLGGRSLFGILRALRPWTAAKILLLALLITAIFWYFGADVSHSILIGGAITTLWMIGVVTNDSPDFGQASWSYDSRSNEQGARRDIAQLSRSLRGSYGRVGSGAVLRVQRLAKQRLAPYQLDLLSPQDRPEIEQMIGRRAYALLLRGDRRRPFLRSFIHCLDALDALEPRHPAQTEESS